MYNNKLIGIRDDNEIRIKNGKFSLYISYDNKMYSIPKHILDNLELLNIDSCNTIIDYHLNKCSNIKNVEIKEDIKNVVLVDPQSGSNHPLREIKEDIKNVVRVDPQNGSTPYGK